MHWIPDVPKIIEDQIERENLITQRALCEATPEIKTTHIKPRRGHLKRFKNMGKCL